MALDRIAARLRDVRPEMMRRWRDQVRAAPTSALQRTKLDDAELDDHLPALLDAMIRTLCDEPTPTVETEGELHGQQRRALGYHVTECLWELTVFRRVLLETLDSLAAAPAPISYEETIAARRALLDLFDRSLHASVARFTDEAEHERDATQRRLEDANTALRETNEQKDRFLAMLAHELRNPIAPILTSVQLLKRADVPEAVRVRARDTIERQARYQAKLTDDLLDVNRIARGKVELALDVVDLRDAVAHAVDSSAPSIEAKKQELHVDVPAGTVAVLGDPTRLAQIATNLLGNATKFTPPRGTIRVALAVEGRKAVLRIQDTGSGIAPDLLPRVFDMFTQADTSLDRATGGLGLGLTLARNLVEMHGGRIEARSEGPGTGAEFVVRLPLQSESVAGTRPDGRRRVAVVEDNPDTRTAMADMLRILGFDVVEARDGTEALAAAAEAPPDAYVVDIGLPGMSGFDLASRLRAAAGQSRPLLIALSGYGSADDKRRAREAGFDHHMTKPADADVLHRLILSGART